MLKRGEQLAVSQGGIIAVSILLSPLADRRPRSRPVIVGRKLGGEFMLDIDDGVRGWIFKTATKNYWRLAGWYDLEDLIQDGFMHFYRIRERYADVKDPPHLMSLFKRCYENHITDLANRRTRTPELLFIDLAPPDSPEYDALDYLGGIEEEIGPLLVLLRQAPSEVREVFELFLTDSGLSKLSGPTLRFDGLRETFNEKLCRLLRKDPDHCNVLDVVRSFLMKQEMCAHVNH